MSQPQQIVIMGAGYAGLLTAHRLTHLTNRAQAHITLINAASHFVERIRLHQIATSQPIPSYPIANLINPRRITFVQAEVTAIHTAEKQLDLKGVAGCYSLGYDTLVYALGSRIDSDAVPGVREYAYLPNAPTVEKLRVQIPEIVRQSGKVVVVGAGLTGVEIAAELAEAYPSLTVELLTQGALGADLSIKGRDALNRHFQQAGIAVREQVQVSQVEKDQVTLADGAIIACAAVIWAAGFQVPTLARDAGLAVNSMGQLTTDAMLRSVSHSDIYGVGDAATTLLDTARPQRMGCVTAMPMGAHAARNIAAAIQNKPLHPFRFGYVLRCISLGRRVGLAQRVDPADRPLEQVFTGRFGAIIKETICWFILFSLRAERYISPFYQWPQPARSISESVPVGQFPARIAHE